jgi:hypothetical protein
LRPATGRPPRLLQDSVQGVFTIRNVLTSDHLVMTTKKWSYLWPTHIKWS